MHFKLKEESFSIKVLEFVLKHSKEIKFANVMYRKQQILQQFKKIYFYFNNNFQSPSIIRTRP